MFLIVLLDAIWASTFTVGKMALRYASPFFYVGVRMIIAGTLLMAYRLLTGKRRLMIAQGDWWLFFQIAFIGIFIMYCAEFWGMQYVSSFKASLFFNLSPFTTVLFSYFFFAERMTVKKWIGMVIGFIGLLPMLMASSHTESQYMAVSFISLPELAVLLGVVSYAYSWIVMRRLVKYKGYTAVEINGIVMLLGGIFALCASFLAERGSGVCTHNIPHFLLYTLLSVFAGNIISYNLYAYLLKQYTATLLAFCSFITPLFTSLYGWLFLNERVSSNFFISFVAVMIGLYLFYQEELKQGYI